MPPKERRNCQGRWSLPESQATATLGSVPALCTIMHDASNAARHVEGETTPRSIAVANSGSSRCSPAVARFRSTPSKLDMMSNTTHTFHRLLWYATTSKARPGLLPIFIPARVSPQHAWSRLRRFRCPGRVLWTYLPVFCPSANHLCDIAQVPRRR